MSLAGPHASAVHEAVAVALKRHGLETTSADVSGDAPGPIAEAARRGRLAAVIIGEVHEGGKRLKLRVYGAGGDLIGESSWAEAGGTKKLEVAVERTLWSRLGGSLAKARPAGAPKAEKGGKGGAEAEEAAEAGEGEEASAGESSEGASPPDEEEAPAARKPKKHPASDEGQIPAAGTALDLSVGPRFVSRSFSWSPQVPALRGYSLPFAPSVGGLVAWYPAAHGRGGWLSNLGVAASAEYTPGLESQTSDGARYPTTESDYWGGARGRLLFGVAHAALTLGAGQQSFIFHSQGAAMRSNLADLPDVKYTYGRAALDLRLTLPANLSFMAGAGYRYVFNGGTENYLIEAKSYFPSSTFVAFDATAAVGYRFLSLLEARAGFDVRRYQVTAGSNTYMVTAATDQYLAFWVQLALLVDGFGGHE